MCDLTFKQPVTDCNALFTNSAENANKPTAVNTGVNNAKMREALTEARKVIKAMGGYWARETLPIIDAALAAPPRNCDVGTAEEQAERFFNFCDGYMHSTGYKNCGTCPLWVSGTVGHDCELNWAQMPYEEGGEK